MPVSCTVSEGWMLLLGGCPPAVLLQQSSRHVTRELCLPTCLKLEAIVSQSSSSLPQPRKAILEMCAMTDHICILS